MSLALWYAPPKGERVADRLLRTVRTLSTEARVLLMSMFFVCAVVAQKTNDPPRGASAPCSEIAPGNGGDAIDTSPVIPRCGDGVPPSLLTAADYEAGFVLAEARYGEAHDFAPPEGAVICDDWRRHCAIVKLCKSGNAVLLIGG